MRRSLRPAPARSSIRLQVVLEASELREIQRAAQRDRLTVSAWVRRSLREARRRQPGRDAGRKLRAIRLASRHDFPTADIDQMLAEIERGYLGQAAEGRTAGHGRPTGR